MEGNPEAWRAVLSWKEGGRRRRPLTLRAQMEIPGATF